MSAFNFPFSSPSVPDATAFDNNAVISPVTPQTPTPDTLPILTNPSKYLVANKQSGSNTSPFQVITSPIAVPAKVVNRSRASSTPSFQHGKGKRLPVPNYPNPFSDDHVLVTPPAKPWLNNHHGNGSEVDSIASSVTFHTAAPASLAHQSSRHGLLSNMSVPSLTNFKSTRSRADTAKSLKLEAIVRQIKLHERKLEIEQTKEKLKRLASNAAKSQLSVPLEGQTLWRRIYLLNHPVFKKIIGDTWFWAMLLLSQCGVVSTAACIGVIYSYDRYGDKIRPSTARVFWLVCSIAAMLISLVSCVIICVRKGNCCLGAQDKMGLNEIRDLDNGSGDIETGRDPGLLYLGVSDRDEGSVLGDNCWQPNLGGNPSGTNLSVGSALKAHGLRPRHYETAWDFLDSFARAGQWPSDAPIIEDTIKNPEWHDLYVAPEPTKYSGSVAGGSVAGRSVIGGSPAMGGRGRSKFKNGGDLGEQRLMSSENGESNKMGVARGQGLGLRRFGESKDFETVPLENRSLLSFASTGNGYVGGGRKEVQGWSPLDRFARILTGKLTNMATKPTQPTNPAISKPAKKSNFTEEFELASLRISPTDTPAVKDGESGQGVEFVTEQTMEYPWSPAVIEARMKKRTEERENERLKLLREEKSRVKGVSVKERAKQFEEVENGGKAQEGIVAGDEEYKGMKEEESSTFAVGGDPTVLKVFSHRVY